MRKIFYILVFCCFFSCQKLSINAENEFSGTYKVINDPLKCALPTSNSVTLKHKMGNKYEINYTHINAGKQVIDDVLVLENGDEKILSLNENEIGIYKMDSYMELGKKTLTQSEGYVLYLNTTIDGLYLEFMGKK